MPTKALAYKEIMRQYELTRNAHTALQRRRQAEIYKRQPRLEQIDREINLTGVKLAKVALGEASGKRERMEAVKQQLYTYRTEKLDILKKMDISPAFLELQFDCEACKDTGFIGSQRCTCLKQKLVDFAYEQSNLKDIIQHENFKTFDISYYAGEVDSANGVSPRENMRCVVKIAKQFVDTFGKEFQNLLFYGDTGLGKTFLCNCIAKELLDRGKTVMYVTAARLFKMIEEEKFNRQEEDVPTGYMEDVLSVDLFIIDDLGTEFSTILSSSELFHIINVRMLNRAPVVLSTNLSPAFWGDQYSDRIVSRLVGGYRTLKFFGEDIRVMKKFGKNF